MKDDYINGITKNSEFEDAMFIDILGTEDTIRIKEAKRRRKINTAYRQRISRLSPLFVARYTFIPLRTYKAYKGITRAYTDTILFGLL